MKRQVRAAAAAASVGLAAMVLGSASPASAGVVVIPTETIFGLTSGGNLIRFESATPGTIADSDPITGLLAEDSLVGMDFRPATGELFAVSAGSRIYEIDPATAVATVVGSAGAFTLSGGSFGVDFNPVPDRIRLTSDADQNLRLNPNDGTLSGTDGTLAYAVGDPNAAANPNVVASAYTNSADCATSTTLYNIDSALDVLVIQNPPNNGTLITVGALGVDAATTAGFDISNATSTAYAALSVGGTSGLYTINLATGAATSVGLIGAGDSIRDIAVRQGGARPSSYSILDNGVVEGDAGTVNLSYGLTRTVAASQAVTLNVSTTNGTATSPADFVGLTNSSVVFPGGCSTTNALSTITVNGDDLVEPDETFTATISGISASTASIEDASATMTILDDDFPGSRPAVVRGNQWFLRNSLSTGVADTTFAFGTAGDTALFCDGDGNGTSTAATFRNGTWSLRNSNTAGAPEVTFAFGAAGDVPVCGDWDGDGDETPGVRRGTTFLLRNANSNGPVDLVVSYGNPGDVPIVGDWDGNGTDTVGVVRNATWFLRNANTTGVADSTYGYGNAGDAPVVGDWDGDGDDTAGIVRGGNWFLRNGAAGGNADVTPFSYGNPGDPARSFKVVGTV